MLKNEKIDVHSNYFFINLTVISLSFDLIMIRAVVVAQIIKMGHLCNHVNTGLCHIYVM